MGIGERLKEERERIGLNQTEFATRAGASKNSQYNYEKGERSPDATYLAAAAGMGVDVLYVVTGERTPQPADSISPGEAGLLQRYRQLSEDDQAGTARMVAAMAEVAGRYEAKKE